MSDELITLKEVFKLTGFKSRNTIIKLVGKGGFPAPIRIGENSLRWKKVEVEMWVMNRPRELF